jgi:uncharacterized protein (TIGR03086 family)
MRWSAMSLPDDPAGRYTSVSDAFTQLVDGTSDWDSPAPVSGWTAADVVWHLVGWIPDVLRDGAEIDLPRGDRSATNPAGDWVRFDEAIRAVVARPDVMTGEFAHPMAGTMTVGAAIDMLVTPDVFMHSWDLARASGQSVTLDPDYAAGLLSGMEGIEDLLRSSGHYGQRVDVPADADVQTRLIAFIGRDPYWRADGVSGASA